LRGTEDRLRLELLKNLARDRTIARFGDIVLEGWPKVTSRDERMQKKFE